jgi:hypothetical protein
VLDPILFWSIIPTGSDVAIGSVVALAGALVVALAVAVAVAVAGVVTVGTELSVEVAGVAMILVAEVVATRATRVANFI